VSSEEDARLEVDAEPSLQVWRRQIGWRLMLAVAAGLGQHPRHPLDAEVASSVSIA
jgi:hypothetical protein